MKILFGTVTDIKCFAGTLVGIRSLLSTNPWVSPDKITVFYRRKFMKNQESMQINFLKAMGVNIVYGDRLLPQGKKGKGAWELKSIGLDEMVAANKGARIIMFDADLFFCNDILEIAKTGHDIMGGLDGEKPRKYDSTWSAYDFEVPTENPHYISASCLFVKSTPAMREITALVRERTTDAVYNKTGKFRGHGDQGLLNATLLEYNLKAKKKVDIGILDNRMWSHHHTSEKDDFVAGLGLRVNNASIGKPIFTYHCIGGAGPKLWDANFWGRRLLEPHQRVLAERMFYYLFSEDFPCPIHYSAVLQKHLIDGSLNFNYAFVPHEKYAASIVYSGMNDISDVLKVTKELSDDMPIVVHGDTRIAAVIALSIPDTEVIHIFEDTPQANKLSSQLIPNLRSQFVGGRLERDLIPLQYQLVSQEMSPLLKEISQTYRPTKSWQIKN